jgi:hypothetical protein
VLASTFYWVWTTLFWGHGLFGRGSISNAVVFDLAILLALIGLVSRQMGRLRKRANGPESGASAEGGQQPGLRSEASEIASSLNPFHHDPLSPFPGTPDDEPK